MVGMVKMSCVYNTSLMCTKEAEKHMACSGSGNPNPAGSDGHVLRFDLR